MKITNILAGEIEAPAPGAAERPGGYVAKQLSEMEDGLVIKINRMKAGHLSHLSDVERIAEDIETAEGELAEVHAARKALGAS